MSPSTIIRLVMGFFVSAVSSLFVLIFMSLPLGVHVGFSFGCFLFAVVGLVGIVRSDRKHFFVGWLAWVALLTVYIVVTLFL
ncbi:hypothetical protein [Nonomuraea sp. NPDC049480]|uniref:hypothetical protein n=1 Tax=Nonomuraea sp. NPDC049480 TaxID=3364353 RepID=UPI0037B8BCA9